MLLIVVQDYLRDDIHKILALLEYLIWILNNKNAKLSISARLPSRTLIHHYCQVNTYRAMQTFENNM